MNNKGCVDHHLLSRFGVVVAPAICSIELV
jgi:hypothetical protein